MNNTNDTYIQPDHSIGSSLSEQIIIALFENLKSQVEFDNTCIEALKTLANSRNLTNEQQVLAALKKTSKV